jgi:hypothetical protein
MPRFHKSLWLALLCFFPHVTAPQSQSPVSQITIDSSAGGSIRARGPVNRHLVIAKESDQYFSTGDNTDKAPVDRALIASLIAAVNVPFRDQPSLEAVGLSPDWLKANASSIATITSNSVTINGEAPSAEEIANVLSSPAAAQSALNELFRSFHTDDYPSVQVQITFEDGTVYSLISHSQRPLMLPWGVQAGDKRGTAYNFEISNAIAALMANNTSNRSRLQRQAVADRLSIWIADNNYRQQHLQSVEKKYSDALGKMRVRYTVTNVNSSGASVMSSHPNDPDHEYLYARLHAPSMPDKMTDDVAIRLTNGQVENIDNFLSNAARLESIVLSVPWLKTYLAENPSLPATLHVTEKASLDDDSLRRFSSDMHAISKDMLTDKVEARKDAVALITLGTGFPSSDWIVFPDGTMLLWRFRSLSKETMMLRWQISDLNGKNCPSSIIRCSGDQITPSGGLWPRK